MDESLYNLVNRLFSFLTAHFYEIILILLVFLIADVALSYLARNKKRENHNSTLKLILEAHY